MMINTRKSWIPALSLALVLTAGCSMGTSAGNGATVADSGDADRAIADLGYPVVNRTIYLGPNQVSGSENGNISWCMSEMLDIPVPRNMYHREEIDNWGKYNNDELFAGRYELSMLNTNILGDEKGFVDLNGGLNNLSQFGLIQMHIDQGGTSVAKSTFTVPDLLRTSLSYDQATFQGLTYPQPVGEKYFTLGNGYIVSGENQDMELEIPGIDPESFTPARMDFAGTAHFNSIDPGSTMRMTLAVYPANTHVDYNGNTGSGMIDNEANRYPKTSFRDYKPFIVYKIKLVLLGKQKISIRDTKYGQAVSNTNIYPVARSRPEFTEIRLNETNPVAGNLLVVDTTTGEVIITQRVQAADTTVSLPKLTGYSKIIRNRTYVVFFRISSAIYDSNQKKYPDKSEGGILYIPC